MVDFSLITELINFIQSMDGIGDKQHLSEIVSERFDLQKERSLYYCSNFAVRFSLAQNNKPSNTILSLSKLKQYDHIPVILCIVTPHKNYMLLINSTFLQKVSQSSHLLQENNIKGSFNANDIKRIFDELDNSPENFKSLFMAHQQIGFKQNLQRLIQNNKDIIPHKHKYLIKDAQYLNSSILRTINFCQSNDFFEIDNLLNQRIKKISNEVSLATKIDNINIRGRLIEYLITEDDCDLKRKVIQCLKKNKPLPKFSLKDGLGDYTKTIGKYTIQIDIKTKLTSLASNPKGYNIDKILSFLNQPNSIYLLFIVAINENGHITTRLLSIFDELLIQNTAIVKHWAGRNCRGTAQFHEKALSEILLPTYKAKIDFKKAESFLQMLKSL